MSMTNNKFVIEVEFDKESWDSIGEYEKGNWLEELEDNITQVARITSLFTKES